VRARIEHVDRKVAEKHGWPVAKLAKKKPPRTGGFHPEIDPHQRPDPCAVAPVSSHQPLTLILSAEAHEELRMRATTLALTKERVAEKLLLQVLFPSDPPALTAALEVEEIVTPAEVKLEPEKPAGTIDPPQPSKMSRPAPDRTALKAAGERLLAARKNAELSQRALAEKAGVHQTLISQIEQGSTALTTDTAAKLATALNVAVAHLQGQCTADFVGGAAATAQTVH
jgi:DNA-binding XRE family transcriptional regulator